jgi:5,10-methylenetetrahydromethanopterin reductase
VLSNTAAQQSVTPGPLRIGMRTPAWRPLPEVADFAKSVEDMGFDTVSLTDSPMLWRDSMAALAVIAMRTERIALSTAVTNPITRPPVMLASSCRTVAELAPGRFRLGLATGDSAVLLAGSRPARLVEFREAVRIIRDALAGRAPFESAPNTTMVDPPAQHVPIFCAADGPKMLALAVEIGDGVITNNKNLDKKRAHMNAVAKELGIAVPYHSVGVSTRVTNDIQKDAIRLKPFAAKYIQREGPEFLEGLGFHINVPDRDYKLPDGTDLAHPRDMQQAIDIASQWITDDFAVWFAQNLAMWGDAKYVAGRMVDMWKQGVNEILARTDGAFTFPREVAEAIASDVIPLVREATGVPVGMAQPRAALAK